MSAVADSPAEVIQAAWNRCRLAPADAAPRIATRTLIPITAPICWNIETIALPVAVCSGAWLTDRQCEQRGSEANQEQPRGGDGSGRELGLHAKVLCDSREDRHHHRAR